MESRLQAIKEQLFKSYYEKKEWWGDDLSIFSDDPACGLKPIVIRKALAIQKVCREMPIGLNEHELITGKPTMASVGFGHTFPQYETAEEAEAAAKVLLNRKSVWGHHNPNYERILKNGLKAVAGEAEELKSKLSEKEPEKKEWYEAVIISLASVEILANRYAYILTEKADKTENYGRKEELLEMARICRKVPMQQAESFHEALQSVWFVHIILHSTLNYTSLGRLDQYLYPYYKNDIDKGSITDEFARELLGSFMVKFNERIQLNNDHIEDHMTFGDWSQGGEADETSSQFSEQLHFNLPNNEAFNYGQTSNSWLQNCILSGITPEGKDGTNELTYLIMELSNTLEITNPLVSVRMHRNSPKKLFRTVSELLAKGGAQPTIFNDDVLIPGLISMGIDEKDARDYTNDGCWETLPQGKTQTAFGQIDALLALESFLNRGKSFINNNLIGTDFGCPSQYKTFDEFSLSFKQYIKEKLDVLIGNKVKYYDEVYKIAPDPLLSAIVDDCLKVGRDITQKGARYCLYAPLLTGLSHTVDSLAAIKHLIYEKKMITIEQLVEILRNNWKGEEKIRQYVLNRIPKYGNDDDYVDSINVDLLDSFCNNCEEWNKKIAWMTITPGIGTFENYAKMGFLCGASADGRLAQAALASNYSPSFGMDKNGPTAIIKSATRFDLRRLNDGSPVDLVISFSSPDSLNSFEALEAFIRSFIEIGGNILTITSTNEATLREAQREPKKYASLRVRLGGLTAYFVQLCETQQNEYIKRTNHTF